MPSTTYIDASQGVMAIGARTDFDGTEIEDLAAEEARYVNTVLSPGVLTPNAYIPVPGSPATMTVEIGSGNSKSDYLVVVGDTVGQGNYLVRLSAGTESVSLAAADASLDRRDEVYVVVRDNAYDASSRALPVLAVRQGDPGGGLPGPDTSWKAAYRVASILIPAGAADITECTVTDTRGRAGFVLGGSTRLGFNSNGDTLVSAASGKKVLAQIDGATKFEVGATTADFKNLSVIGVAALEVGGVDILDHDHSPGGVGGTISHGDLADLSAGDPHTQYLLKSGLTKAAIDALNVNADTVDGQHASAFAAAAHNHDGAYSAAGHIHDERYFTGAQSDGRYYGPSSAGGRKLTISTSGPSGGSNGDIWIVY